MINAEQSKTSPIFYKYTISGDPIPWMRPRVKGRNFYDGQAQLKLIKGIDLRNQLGERDPYSTGLILIVIFYMPMPASWSARKRQEMSGKPHISRPDFSNMLKFMEDLAVDVRILRDDCLIAEVNGRKVYDENPRTEFIFQEI